MRFSAGPETPPVYCFISLGIIYDDAWCGLNKHQLSRALKTGSGWNDTCDETASTTARLPSCQTPSTGLRHPSFGGRGRKAMLGVCPAVSLTHLHIPSVAFRQLSPNSAAEWGTLYLRAAIHRRCQRPPKGLGTNKTVEASWRQSTHVIMRRVRPD